MNMFKVQNIVQLNDQLDEVEIFARAQWQA